MEAIELILEFDLFAYKHKEKCKNEKVNVIYLFMYEKLIEIM